MEIDKLIREDLIFAKQVFLSKEKLFEFFSRVLEEKGFVESNFYAAIIEREEKFPTGLQLNGLNIAVPHTDIKYVKQSGICVVTLKEPLYFRKMDSPENEIAVHIIFLLLISEPTGYVQFLSKLTQAFSKRNFLNEIYHESNPKKILETLENVLEEREMEKQ